MFQNQEMIILLLKLMMSVSSFLEDSWMVQEQTSALLVKSKTMHYNGNRLELRVKVNHALEQVTVHQYMKVKCISSVDKTTRIINWMIYGNSTSRQKLSPKLNCQMTPINHHQEVDIVLQFIKVACTFSVEFLSWLKNWTSSCALILQQENSS